MVTNGIRREGGKDSAEITIIIEPPMIDQHQPNFGRIRGAKGTPIIAPSEDTD
jgi:hypothetical protein